MFGHYKLNSVLFLSDRLIDGYLSKQLDIHIRITHNINHLCKSSHSYRLLTMFIWLYHIASNWQVNERESGKRINQIIIELLELDQTFSQSTSTFLVKIVFVQVSSHEFSDTFPKINLRNFSHDHYCFHLRQHFQTTAVINVTRYSLFDRRYWQATQSN